MTRFQTLNGQSLGVTFFGGTKLGTLKFQTQTELDLLWSLDETEFATDDNGMDWTICQIKDRFFKLDQATDQDMIQRGWGDRLQSGLSFQTCISDEGKLFLTR